MTQFNLKPKAGIQYLVNEGIVDADPDSVAEFLLTAEGESPRTTRAGCTIFLTAQA